MDEAAVDVPAVALDDRRRQASVVGDVEVCEEDDDDDPVSVCLRRRVEDRLNRVEHVHVASRTLGRRDADRQEICARSRKSSGIRL